MRTFIVDHQTTTTTLVANDETIVATGGHPFWVVRGVDLESRSLPGKIAATEATDQPGRWVLAEELRVGDVLLGQSNQLFPIEEISSVTLPMPMYNFHVEELENYCVGSCGFLVHNTNDPTDGTPPGALKPPRLSPKARDLLEGRDVTVTSIKEADRLLKEALPDAKKVIGTGPGQSSAPDWSKFKGKHPDGMYHKDYHFDPATGRIYGHGEGNPHGNAKHINVKLPDGTKVTIIILPR